MIEVTIILLVYLFAKLALDILQIYTIKRTKIDKKSMLLLDISEENAKKSREYNISKLHLSIIKNIFYVGYIYLFLLAGLFKYINESLNNYDLSLNLVNLSRYVINMLE